MRDKQGLYGTEEEFARGKVNETQLKRSLRGALVSLDVEVQAAGALGRHLKDQL